MSDHKSLAVSRATQRCRYIFEFRSSDLSVKLKSGEKFGRLIKVDILYASVPSCPDEPYSLCS